MRAEAGNVHLGKAQRNAKLIKHKRLCLSTRVPMDGIDNNEHATSVHNHEKEMIDSCSESRLFSLSTLSLAISSHTSMAAKAVTRWRKICCDGHGASYPDVFLCDTSLRMLPVCTAVLFTCPVVRASSRPKRWETADCYIIPARLCEPA